MSSLGGQWRVLRHYVSSQHGQLQAELEKLLQRIKPTADIAQPLPTHWHDLIKKLESISLRLSRGAVPEGAGGVVGAGGAGVEEVKGAGVGVGSEARELSVQGVLQGLRLKKDLHFGNVSQPTWKNNKPVVTKTSIHSRTSYVISAIVSAESEACVAKRTEDFIQHINQYPEARDLAIKEGALRALLRVQDRVGTDHSAGEVAGIINEALALVGYCAPVGGPGPNILALDGGGIRGLIAIEVLRHLERLTGRPVHRLFDYIVGVSTGAIIAAVIGAGVGNLETASKLYRTLSKEMFGNTSLIGGASRLVWSHSYYDTAAWEKMLQDNLGDRMLTHCNRKNNPKMALVSCVVSGGDGQQRLSPFLFRTYSCGFRVRGALRGTTHARVWHAVRASAAAPTYFQEFHQGGLVHQDGGLMVNNPAGVGVQEARLLWGGSALARGTVLSLGTGRAPAARTPAARHSAPAHDDDPRGTSWKDKFNTILDSATDTEGVHLLLNDLLPSGSYYRLNPPLTEPCAMDEVDPAKLDNMLADTHAYIRRNQHKFEQAARRLTHRRTVLQRAADAATRRAVLAGLTTYH